MNKFDFKINELDRQAKISVAKAVYEEQYPRICKLVKHELTVEEISDDYFLDRLFKYRLEQEMIKKYHARDNVNYIPDPWSTRSVTLETTPISKLQLRITCYAMEQLLEEFYLICNKLELALTIDEFSNSSLITELMFEKQRRELLIKAARKRQRWV